MSDLTRAILDDLLPDGPAWEPEEDNDLDLLLEGVADNHEVIRAFLAEIADIRNPNLTTILDDLEREYGIPTNTLLSEATRRMRLAELVYGAPGNGTEDDLQTALQNVGFNVYVYQNDPAVDPAIFLDQLFQMVAGGDNAYAGRSDAFAGRTGGELLVNGEIFETKRIWTSVAGEMWAGDGHGAGEYDDLLITKQEYPIPTDPADWPMVFFVGGVATYGFIELLLNGDFEDGDFTDWIQNSSTIDATNPASGTYCSKLVASGSPVAGAESVKKAVFPKWVYTVKAKVDVDVYVAGVHRLFVKYYDADELLISTVSQLWTAVTAGYEALEFTFGPIGSGADFFFPPGTAFISVQHAWLSSPTGTAYLDDVEIYRSDKQSITDIAQAQVDGTREDEFKRMILRYKPLHAWAALIVTFT